MSRWAAAAALGLLVAGCGSMATKSGDEVEELRRLVYELQKKAAVTEVELARLRQQVSDLAGPASPPSVSPPARSPVPRPVPSTPPPAARPRPLIEESDLAVDTDEVEPATVAEPMMPAVAVAAGAVVPPEAQRIYDEAYTLYHQKRYEESELAFRRFLESNPGTELSDNAQFWVGATRFAREDYPGALRAFRETVERYPDQNKVPDALFKIGQCLEEIGEPASAADVYDELKARFPDTAAASLGEDRRLALAEQGLIP